MILPILIIVLICSYHHKDTSLLASHKLRLRGDQAGDQGLLRGRQLIAWNQEEEWDPRRRLDWDLPLDIKDQKIHQGWGCVLFLP